MLPKVPNPDAGNALNQPRYEYDYDERGQLVAIRDPLGRETAFTYDEQGRRTSRTLPLGQVESWQYDRHGRLERHTDFLGQATEYTYDDRGRVTTVAYFAVGGTPAGTVVSTYDIHDAEGTHETVLDSRHHATVPTERVYDREGRLIRISTPEGTIHYEYDHATGHKVRMTTDHTDIRYAHDALGRLEAVTAHELDGTTLGTPLATTYAYDAAGQLESTALPNGTTEARTYDDLGRLVSVVHTDASSTVLASFTYTLDASGHRTAVDEIGGRRVEYTYDNLHRLTRERILVGGVEQRTFTYTYDLVGNRRSSGDSAGGPQDQRAYAYDANDRLESITSGTWREAHYAYDANGALLTEQNDFTGTTTTNTWDVAGRLVSSTNGLQTFTFRYNAQGIRVGRADGTGETTYLVDPLQAYDQVLEEYAPGGALLATYVHGLDLIFQDRGGDRSYYHVDGLGSTRALTDADGDVTDTYVYDAYGQLIGGTQVTPNDYRFTGEQYDGGLGQYYLRARYYDASAGRFTSRDTYYGRLINPITINYYIYTGNNPVNYIDHSGHEFSLIGSLSASSIGSTINAIDAEAGEHALEAAKDVANGVAVDQAILNRVASKGSDLAAGAFLSVAFATTKALLATGKTVVGFAKVGGGLVMPGTILKRTREIPGTLGGVVTGGKSELLKRNLLRANGIAADVPVTGLQAHHLIPSQLRDHRVLKAIGMDLDDATNGILLSTTSVHRGPHSEYSRAVRTALDAIPAGSTVARMMDRVYEIQSRAVLAFTRGATLTPPARTSYEDWVRILLP